MLKRRLLAAWIGVAAAASISSGCATSRDVLATEIAHSNTQTVLAFEETVFNKHRVKEGFDRYVGANYRQHDPMLPDGKEGAIKALSALIGGISGNSRVIVKRTVAQGDLVAVHILWNQKPGESRGVASVDIYRLESGRIVEHWNVVQEVPEKSANDNTLF